MTPEEQFDAAAASALRDREDLVRFLEGVSEAGARFQPPGGEWSIAEGAEHILLTEPWVREFMGEALRKAGESGEWDTAPDKPVKMTYEALRRREQGRVEAPAHLLPRGGRGFAEMRDSLLPDRRASLDLLLPHRSRNLSRLVIPSASYGDLHFYDRIHYLGIHDYLHREQMERVLRAPGFPAAGPP
ncbi:MAG: DinB family protein [bacterium]